MKRKLLIALLLVVAFSFVFAISTSAYKINYDNKASAETDGSGSIVLRDTTVNNLNTTEYTIKDKDGNDIKIKQQFLGWYTDDGRVFAPGETATFTEDTRLYQASGAIVYNYDDLNQLLGKGWWFIKLGADITTTKKISTCNGPSGTMSILDMNGHSITTSSAQAFGASRSGLMLVGEGEITHTGTTSFFDTSYHTYNPNNIRLYIGRDITVTSSAVLYVSNDVSGTSGLPKIGIWGNATAVGICKLDKSTNAVIGVYNGATVVLTGETPINYTNKTGANLYANMRFEGNITLTNPNAIMFNDFLMSSSVEIAPITTGKFTVSSQDAKNLLLLTSESNMLKPTENADGTITYDIVASDCTHNWVLNEEKTIKAVLGQNGLDVFDCTLCQRTKEEIAVFTPENVEITVTVKEESGNKEYTMLAGEVFKFEMDRNGSQIVCSITDVIYRKNDIVKLEIPYGVNLVNLSALESLVEISFMDNSTITFKAGAISNCPLLEKVILGSSFENAPINFTNGTNENTEAGFFVNCPKLETLDVSKASANFNNYSFASNKTIKHLILGEGKTYNFGEFAFAHSQLTEVIIPDNTPITYKKKSFAETTTIEYVYIGANCIADKKISDQSSLFGGNSNLSKVVLMDIEYIGQWVLSTKKTGNKYEALCDIVVYAHSENLSLHNESFNDRTGNYIVYLYTATKTLSQLPTTCNYVIFNGIGHAYTEGVITESTCVTPGKGGYATDCPCNIDYRENAYTSISNKLDQYKNKSYEALGTEEYDLPLKTEHTKSDTVISIAFENGFTNLGTKVYKCLYCDEVSHKDSEATFPAIFTFNGYSIPMHAELAMAVGYSINQEALEDYEEITGKALEYGVVGALTERLEGKAPLAQTTAPVVKASLNGYDIKAFDFIIRGFNEDQCDLAVTMCAYVYDGEKYVYLQKTQSELPYSMTINQIVAEATA